MSFNNYLMSKNNMSKFQDIINFAIDRENEAAMFYKDLQGKVKQQSSVKFLKELEMMEIGHSKLLASFNTEEIVNNYVSPEIIDLKICDYFEEVVPNQDMNFQEVLILAMKKEEEAMNLYNSLALHIPDENANNIFLKLAVEESKHKNWLETIYDDEIFKEN